MNNNHLFFWVFGAVASSNAATIFSDLGTPATATDFTFTSQTLTGVNDTATYLAAVVGDDSIDWSLPGENNNTPTPRVSDYRARFRLTSLVGSSGSSITLLDTASNGSSLNIQTNGLIESFTLQVEYIDSSENSIGMAGRVATQVSFGPMAHFLNQSSEAVNLGLGILDGNFNLITGIDYDQIGAGRNFQSTAPITAEASANGGIMEFAVGTTSGIRAEGDQKANLFDFDDGTVTQDDDLFSGLVYQVEANDGEFANGTVFNLSFDSQLISPMGIPEPSSLGLLAVTCSGLLFRRARKS